jgi:phosphonatase-like hydrolase
MDIELVVFDIAGTTLNDDDSVNRCVRDSLARFGYQVTAAQVNAVMGLNKPEAIATLLERVGGQRVSHELVSEIHRDFEVRSMQFYAHDPSVHEVEGTTRVFLRLRQAGIRVALDTGFNRSITAVILERLNWSRDRLIDASISSDEVTRGRPHPDMVLELMNRFHLADPRRVAKVGDTPADLLEGRNAGCGLIVGVTSGTHSRSELEPFPHTHFVDSVRDVPALLGLELA